MIKWVEKNIIKCKIKYIYLMVFFVDVKICLVCGFVFKILILVGCLL